MVFFFVGIFAGIAAGMLGVGGGIVTVPAMIFLLPFFGVVPDSAIYIAIATSLLLIIPTGIVSAYAHHRYQSIDWVSVRRLLPGLIFGSIIGVYCVSIIDATFLKGLFASFLVVVAIRMLLKQENDSIQKVVEDKQIGFSWSFLLPGVSIGWVSAMMGVGGGTMTVPYLVRRGIDIKKAIGSSAFCGIPIAVVASFAFVFVQMKTNNMPTISLIYWPAFVGIVLGALSFAPVGAWLSRSLNRNILRLSFSGLLLLVAARLLFH